MLQTISNGEKTITVAKQQKLKEIKTKLFDATDGPNGIGRTTIIVCHLSVWRTTQEKGQTFRG